MPTSMSSSYGIIIPDLRHFIIVNAQPGEDLDELIIINSSPTTDHHASTIHDYNHIRSMLFDNGPAYTTLQMEFTTNIHGSVATARFLDDDDEDHEASMTIARFIIHHQSLYGADGISEEKSPVEIVGIGKGEAGGEICVICQKAYEEYEMMGRLLECRHGYHVECINRWLLHKNVCPICRATVSWL